MALEDAPYAVELDGVTLAVLDTVVPGDDGGQLTADQRAVARRPRRGVDRPDARVRAPLRLQRRSPERRAPLVRDQPDRQRRARRGVRPAARRSPATSPATPTATGSAGSGPRPRVPCVRGGLHQGLSGRLGRVPGLRGRLHAGGAAGDRPRRLLVGRDAPGACTPASTATTPWAPSSTAASPTTSSNPATVGFSLLR